MIRYFDPIAEQWEIDHGTPKVSSNQMVKLTIDGQDSAVPAGTSVFRAASEMGVSIPKLCATDSLEPFGSCRMCVVDIEGVRGKPASCTTPVREGMVVHTQTDEVVKLRRNIMELYLSDHPVDDFIRPTDGDCELQEVADAVGLSEVRYGFGGENHLDAKVDDSNPYFNFDSSKCILCSRCVRACDEIQGTMALTIQGRGFDSVVVASQNESFMDSECVSCGACVQACPTASLIEKSVEELGQPEHAVITTCAYCGVGCSFKAEMRGEQVVRMVPYKGGHANQGHSCVKGRFAYSYATSKDRVTEPMIRDSINQPWQKVSWQEAIDFAADRLKAIQTEYGKDSIGAISSSRCTNEEVYLVQKMARAGFGTNNIDTCARVCHSPTGFGLKATLSESAGTQTFESVMQADVIMVMGANPTQAHPVFGSQLKRRVREGAKLIIADPRVIDLVSSAGIKADYHLPMRPGTNVAFINAMAHVAVTSGNIDEAFIGSRCDAELFANWQTFISDERHSPEQSEAVTGIPAADMRAAAMLYAQAPNAAIYYGLGVTEHTQGSTAVMGIANLAMATGNLGREGVGVNPLRGQNNVQGSCDMGSFPHELPGYRHISDALARGSFESAWGVGIDSVPGLRIPNMFEESIGGRFKGLYCQGEDIAQSDPNTLHVERALTALDCLIVQDLFLNETAKYAHVFLPGSSFLEKDGTFTNAERRINRVRKVMEPLSGKDEWQITIDLCNAMGYAMSYSHPSEIMDEIASLTPTFNGVSYAKLDQLGSIQWPCDASSPEGTPIMHTVDFMGNQGKFAITEYVATPERTTKKYPLLLTTGRILSQYNVGAQTRRTENIQWHDEDVLEIHPHDAEDRGIADGDWVGIASRSGDTVLRAQITENVQVGVVYTTFHHPFSGANVITTENSDWATNCPEYKVTAVQCVRVMKPSEWQQRYQAFSEVQDDHLKKAKYVERAESALETS